MLSIFTNRNSTEHSCCQGSQFVLIISHTNRPADETERNHTDEELTFIHPEDADLYNAWDSRAFELQVANHELLGHGSGKLFTEDADGKLNFDPAKVIC